jgi:hypothetical protein
MKNYIPFFAIIFLWGCEPKLPTVKEFPVITTLEPAELDSSGVTFRAEILRAGISQTIEHGFTWKVTNPASPGSETTIVGQNIEDGIFELRVDTQLIRGLEYTVQAYASTLNNIVYGNPVTFTSLGDNYAPWALEQALSPAEASIRGVSDGEKGYLTSCVNDGRAYYTFDPVNLLSESSNQPSNEFLCYGKGYAKVGNDFYVASTYRPESLFKYVKDEWDKLKTTPPYQFDEFNGFIMGFPYQNKFYLVGAPNTYQYDTDLNTWEKMAEFPGDKVALAGGTYLNDIAYVVTENEEIFTYDPVLNQWSFFTDYPGDLEYREEIIGYAADNTLYFGYAVRPDRSDPAKEAIFAYSLTDNQWKVYDEGPPQEFTERGRFVFSLDGKVFFVSGTSLWSFDPGRAEFK